MLFESRRRIAWPCLCGRGKSGAGSWAGDVFGINGQDQKNQQELGTVPKKIFRTDAESWVLKLGMEAICLNTKMSFASDDPQNSTAVPGQLRLERR